MLFEIVQFAKNMKGKMKFKLDTTVQGNEDENDSDWGDMSSSSEEEEGGLSKEEKKKIKEQQKQEAEKKKEEEDKLVDLQIEQDKQEKKKKKKKNKIEVEIEREYLPVIQAEKEDQAEDDSDDEWR